MSDTTDAAAVVEAVESSVPGAMAWEVSEGYREKIGRVGVNLSGDDRDNFGQLMAALRELGYSNNDWHANRFSRTADIDLFIEEL